MTFLGYTNYIIIRLAFFCFILLNHEGLDREVYREFQPCSTLSSGSAKGSLDHRFRTPPAYAAQLLTLHQHKSHRKSNQIPIANFKGQQQ